MHPPRDSADMSPKNFDNGAGPGSRDPVNFCMLNTNSSKIAIAAHFKSVSVPIKHLIGNRT